MPARVRSSSITLQHLRYCLAAADHGSFRQAADALLIKQSTLSRSVRQLEDRIGAHLFDRSSGGVRATPIGQIFLKTARSILAQIDELLEITQTTQRSAADRLVVGFYTSLSTGNLRATLIDFRQRLPQVELSMVERSREDLLIGLRNGTVDIAIFPGDVPVVDAVTLPLWSERILVALPPGHMLAERDSIYWTDLRTETVLLSSLDPGRELEALLMTKLVSPSDRPRIDRQEVSRGIIKSLVSAGFGISLVTESDNGASFAGLIYREVRDLTGPSRLGYTGLWRNDNGNPALARFLKLLAERYPFPDGNA
jgi:DNA-binding transcriptional LysR family regulator